MHRQITATWNNRRLPLTPDQTVGDSIRAQDLAQISRAKSGDHTSFEELLNRHAPIARSIAKRMLRHSADAEEVLQDAAWKAFGCADQFHGLSAFRTWRSHRRRSILQLESAPNSKLINRNPSSFGCFHTRQQHSTLKAAVAQLAATYQGVIKLRLESKTVGEIAKELNLSLPTARTRYLRACRMLRDRIGHANSGRTTSAELRSII